MSPSNNAETAITTLDDLTDSRAQRIAKQYQLNPTEIFPLCTELNFSVTESEGKLLIRDVTEDDVAKYEKMLASAAVLGYELSQQQSVQFPAPEKRPRFSGLGRYLPFTVLSIDEVRPDIMQGLEEINWTAQRRGSDKQYEIMGMLFEDNLIHIRHHMQHKEIVIYAQDHVPP